MKKFNYSKIFSKKRILFCLFIVAIFVNIRISGYLLCLSYLYNVIRYTILALLFICYYSFRRSIDNSAIFALTIWIIFNGLSFYYIYSYAQKNGQFITSVQVSSYVKGGGKQSSRIVYYYKGEKQFLYYSTPQLDSLADCTHNPEDKIELKLKLSEFSPSIYYINDFDVKIKKCPK